MGRGSPACGFGFGVWGLKIGSPVHGFGFWVRGLGFGVRGGFRFGRCGFRVSGVGNGGFIPEDVFKNSFTANQDYYTIESS